MLTEEIKIITLSSNNELKHRLQKILSYKNVSILWRKNLDKIKQEMETVTFDILVLMSDAFKNRVDHQIDVEKKIISKSPFTQVLFLFEPKDVEKGLKSLIKIAYQYARRYPLVIGN